jgi:3-phosphoinositide dependent protein kinase-1
VKPLGKGAYSEVALVKNKLTGHESALKIIDKSFVIKVL